MHGEMHGRCGGDTAHAVLKQHLQMQGRCRGHIGEMRGRYRGDTAHAVLESTCRYEHQQAVPRRANPDIDPSP